MASPHPKRFALAACAALVLVTCGDAMTHAAPGTPPAKEAGTPPPAVPPAAPPVAAAAAQPAPVEERRGVTNTGAFVVSWVPMPDPIPFNEPYKLRVTIARTATPDAPEPSARLEVDATMPAHGHGMNRTPHVTGNGDGTFLVEGMLFHMSGEWNLIFHAYAGKEYGQVILRVELP